jgi:hypothetical protein
MSANGCVSAAGHNQISYYFPLKPFNADTDTRNISRAPLDLCLDLNKLPLNEGTLAGAFWNCVCT